MKKKAVAALLVIVVLALVVLVRYKSSGNIKDGYYTAEMDSFSHGWKEYLRIQVKQGTIMSAEFNAKNESGFIKAWDNSYMKNMNSVQDTYPNKYTREYVQQLIDGQKNVEVDVVTGASNSGSNFKKLVAAVLEQAKKGDSKTKVVKAG